MAPYDHEKRHAKAQNDEHGYINIITSDKVHVKVRANKLTTGSYVLPSYRESADIQGDLPIMGS
jgi:IMP cyclohydrolase